MSYCIEEIAVCVVYVQFDAAHCWGYFGFGIDDFGDYEGAGRGHEAGGDELGSDVHVSTEPHVGIDDKDSAGDAGKGTAHGGEEFASGHGCEIRSDHDLGFYLADESARYVA